MSLADVRRRPRILFLGESNDARTQMAEAYMRQIGEAYFEVQSAGMRSSRVDQRAIDAMSEDDMNIRNQRAKLVSGDLLTWADWIIVIAGDDEHFNAPVPSSAIEKRWGVPDPVSRARGDADLGPFREARDAIKRRVNQLVNSVKLFRR